jgi:hypothetical protein
VGRPHLLAVTPGHGLHLKGFFLDSALLRTLASTALTAMIVTGLGAKLRGEQQQPASVPASGLDILPSNKEVESWRKQVGKVQALAGTMSNDRSLPETLREKYRKAERILLDWNVAGSFITIARGKSGVWNVLRCLALVRLKCPEFWRTGRLPNPMALLPSM